MRRMIIAVAATAITAAGVLVATAEGAFAADTPAGFWYGSDSSTIAVGGNAVPYTEPVVGGPYGGYIGMTGNWAHYVGCGKIVVWSATNAAQANANYAKHYGVGTGVYWFMGGPGVDPHYNGTASEAYAWGASQAARKMSFTR